MNKTEKIISILLGCILVWYLFTQNKQQSVDDQTQGQVQGQAQVQQQATAVQQQNTAVAQVPQPVSSAPALPPAKPDVPEETVVLENDELRLELSTWGGVVKKATLKKYARDEGEIGEDNPPVEFDFAASPLGELRIESVGLLPYRIENSTSNQVVFASEFGTRTVTLGEDYLVTYEDSEDVFNAPGADAATISLGVMTMGSSKNDLLSVDSFMPGPKGGSVIHHGDDDSPLKGYLVSGVAGGCSGAKSAAGMPKAVDVPYPGVQSWVALKNRFFVTALVSTTAPNTGFTSTIMRDLKSDTYRPESIAARVTLNASANAPVTSVFYVGPKKQSLLWDLGMRDVMEFGMWRWICYPILWVLNIFNDVIPNYGIAIILLTILVRLLFWPLTHKSTVGMKKMQEIQPLMKELQAKYKDNPQRLQQETFALYREHKVNPLSSCLPMLIQIPVFIALFQVLRSAVELRYAPFLWISDLSQPEALGADSWFPWFGGLNILPILMALTMGLQSALTPSAGDKNQQKMMMIFMPVMMLFMFYSFPSALSLYWTLSQVVSIIQMWVIRRQTQAKQKPAFEIIDPPQTRQMRRHN